MLALLVPSGERAEIVALFDGRASPQLIDHWRAGRALPPQWARETLLQKFEPVRLELLAVAEQLGRDSPRPNNVDALRRYWAKEKGRRLSRP